MDTEHVHFNGEVVEWRGVRILYKWKDQEDSSQRVCVIQGTLRCELARVNGAVARELEFRV